MTGPAGPGGVVVRDTLDPATAEVLAAGPGLSDEARVRLRGAHPGVAHLVLTGDPAGGAGPAGYAQLDGAGALEVVADTAAAAGALLDAALALAPGGVVVWDKNRPPGSVPALGDPAPTDRTPAGPAAGGPVTAALRERDARAERVLWQLHRHGPPAPARPLPPGVVLAPFVPGRDETDWLAVNAAAFAHHPEQGAMTLDDLRARQDESWFDPAGFLLARRGERLAGFHWTKVHAGPPPVGEVYVLGVDPHEQGTGLGGALLDAGLHHLAARGLTTVLLYVDADNPAAVGLYERAGFTRHRADVRYRVIRTAP